MTGSAPTDRVLVSPVYLAGPGNSTVVTHPLQAAGSGAHARHQPSHNCPLAASYGSGTAWSWYEPPGIRPPHCGGKRSAVPNGRFPPTRRGRRTAASY